MVTYKSKIKDQNFKTYQIHTKLSKVALKWFLYKYVMMFPMLDTAQNEQLHPHENWTRPWDWWVLIFENISWTHNHGSLVWNTKSHWKHMKPHAFHATPISSWDSLTGLDQ
jgi:hypothetical protein